METDGESDEKVSLPCEIIDKILILTEDQDLMVRLKRFWLLKSHYDNCDINWAIENGYLEYLKYLNEKGSVKERAVNGRLDILGYCIYDRLDLIAAAAEFGHLAVVKYLHSLRCYITTVSITRAAGKGFLEFVTWLHENRSEASAGPAGRRSENGEGRAGYAVDHAAMNGHLEIVRWLHEQRSESCTTNAMDYAAMNGHLDILKFLHENRSEGCTEKGMNLAAMHGRFDVIKWLYENRSEGCTTLALYWAAGYGHLDIVKWLLDNRSEGSVDQAIGFAKGEGHRNVVDWLRENRTNS